MARLANRWCRCTALALGLGMLVIPARAQAAKLIPGPGGPGYDADLAAKLHRFERQIHGIMTLSLGWGLEAWVQDETARTQIADFIASDAATFQDHTGVHIYEVLDGYGEHGDLGMFGGVQAAGDAFRYAVLRDTGADAAEIALAREHLVAAMDGLHWYTSITGPSGGIARGLLRTTPRDGEPALPGTIPDTVPLFDADGAPLPVEKTGTWRDDLSGELPDLIWLDDTSKDQFIGYVFALGAVHEAVAGDDTIPADKVERLREDARAIAHALMEVHEIDGHALDLVIIDADGRPTKHFDLAPEVLTPDIIRDIPVNPFNAVMSLGSMRTLYQITGDDDIGRYYYDELLAARGYLELAEQSLSVIYFGNGTNHSTVNMAFVAIYPLLRYEPDPELATRYRGLLTDHLYADSGISARGLRQSFFDFIVAGFSVDGTSALDGEALEDGLSTLRDHPDAPYWDTLVENCDEDEISAGICTAVDGTTTITLADSLGWNDTIISTDPLPITLRPPSNFTWRTNPHDVNGGGTSRLNPGGGVYCAYWMGRLLEANDDGLANISPDARPRPEAPEGGSSGGEPEDPPAESTGGTTGGSTSSAPTTAATDGGTGTADGAAQDQADDGCSCAASPSTPRSWWLLPLLLLRRRRGQSRS